MLSGVWLYIASPAASVLFTLVAAGLLVKNGYHRDAKRKLRRRRLASVILLSASIYTFSICFVSQIMAHGPSIGKLVDEGFGASRIAWLLFGLTLDQIFKLWAEYHPDDDG